MSQTMKALIETGTTTRERDSSSLTAVLGMCALGLALSIVVFALSPAWVGLNDPPTFVGLY
jgi:hypothetical protein